MVNTVAVVRNAAGIHVRPSGIIAGRAAEYRGLVTIRAKGSEIDASNVVGLLTLGLLPGDSVEIEVEGANEQETAAIFVELLERKYDFPPRSPINRRER